MNETNGKNYETQFISVSAKNNLLHLNYEPKIRGKNKSNSVKSNLSDVKLKMEKKGKTEISQKNFKKKSFFSKRSNSIKSSESQKQTHIKFISQETENLSKSLKDSNIDESSSSQKFSSEITKRSCFLMTSATG